MEGIDRITFNPAVMGGKPCIRGMRVTVGMILGQLSGGATIDALLAGFPYIEREDVLQALRLGSYLASASKSLPLEEDDIVYTREYRVQLPGPIE